MEHPILILVWLFEKIGFCFFAHHYPEVIYSWFVMIILILLGKIVVGAVKIIPSGGQNFFEIVLGNFENFMVEVMGEHGRPFFPLICTLFLYILLMNWMGLIPGMLAPTSNISTPLSMALPVFFITHFIGMKQHGINYIKHFLGPVWWLAPLMFIIEIISHFSRILSLTFRLFGNILGEDLVGAILILLAGAYFAPLPMMILGLFTSFVQAFIFSLLTMLYIAGSIEEAH